MASNRHGHTVAGDDVSIVVIPINALNIFIHRCWYWHGGRNRLCDRAEGVFAMAVIGQGIAIGCVPCAAVTVETIAGVSASPSDLVPNTTPAATPPAMAKAAIIATTMSISFLRFAFTFSSTVFMSKSKMSSSNEVMDVVDSLANVPGLDDEPNKEANRDLLAMATDCSLRSPRKGALLR